MVKVVETVAEVREQVAAWRREGLTVGLVPTMGYLHDGHKSLIARSVKENDRTVVSDFVNPIQFGPNEDLDSYPRDLDHDIAVVEEGGGDLIDVEPAARRDAQADDVVIQKLRHHVSELAVGV